MRQSLELGRDTYEVSYWGVRAVRFALRFAADAPVPFSTWVHEEYHRSAPRVGSVTSENGSHFRIGHTSGTVYDVSDPELVAMKRGSRSGASISPCASPADVAWTPRVALWTRPRASIRTRPATVPEGSWARGSRSG